MSILNIFSIIERTNTQTIYVYKYTKFLCVKFVFNNIISM